jgi:hypothetical protein
MPESAILSAVIFNAVMISYPAAYVTLTTERIRSRLRRMSIRTYT